MNLTSEDELFSNRSLTKNHIDHGAMLLNELFQTCGRSGDRLIARLEPWQVVSRSSDKTE